MNEREIAVSVICDTLEKGFGNIALNNALGRHKGLSRVQKAFITELVNGTFRNLIRIDYVIDRFSRTGTKKLKPFVQNVLRTGVYQILFLDRVPDSAVCNEAVNLVKKKGYGSLSGFVNGVLRNICRNSSRIQYPDKTREPVRYISVMYSYPEEIIRYWLETYDFDTVVDMCEENGKAPNVTAAVNTLKLDGDSLINELKRDNIGAAFAKVGREMLIISKTSDITESAAFKKGYFHIMDQSSYMCVNILDPKPGETVLDLCAAPGGKSFLSAYKMKNKGEIVSRDISPSRVRMIKKGAERLGTVIIRPETMDAAKLHPEDANKYDRVLVDAPCSGLGIVRKKPDIKYNKTLKDIESLVEIQKSILMAASRYVKPGGVLVYSTCTVSVKENEEIVSWFLDNFSFESADISKYIPENIKCSTLSQGYMNIRPDMWDSDGFFVAKFTKSKGE